MTKRLTAAGALLAAAVGGCFNFNGPVKGVDVHDNSASGSITVAPPSATAPSAAPTPLEPGEIRLLPDVTHTEMIITNAHDIHLFSFTIANPTRRDLWVEPRKFPRVNDETARLARYSNIRLLVNGIETAKILESTSSVDVFDSSQKFMVRAQSSPIVEVRFDLNDTEKYGERLHGTYLGYQITTDSFSIVDGGKITGGPFPLIGQRPFCWPGRSGCLPGWLPGQD